MKEVILMKEAITTFIKGRFDSRWWLHASQARRTAATAPLSGRVRRARCRCASRTPVGNEGESAVLSTCMRRARCRCAIRHTSSNCGRTAYAIRRNQTQSDAIRHTSSNCGRTAYVAFERGNSAPGQSWLPRTCGEEGGRRGEHTSKRPATIISQSCTLPATIKRQSIGHQEAINRPSGGHQEAINDAPRSCALRAGQRATRRIWLRRRRARGPARRSESRLMRRAISMQSACIQRGSQGRHHPWQSACNQHALRGDLKGGIIRGNQHAISVDLKVTAVDLDGGRVIHH
jgi:hypothetical protein